MVKLIRLLTVLFFSYFHWSSCSANEYHHKSSTWTCMHIYPHAAKNATFIGDVIEYTYSLDDQCRMEFGKGFKFCRSFQVGLKFDDVDAVDDVDKLSLGTQSLFCNLATPLYMSENIKW